MKNRGSSTAAGLAVRRAAPWILGGFGLIWALFTLLSEWGDIRAVAAELIAVPAVFVLLALVARRWARLAGLLAVAAAVGSFLFFSVYEVFLGNTGALVVLVLIPLPFLAVGLSLIVSREDQNEV